MNDKAIRNILIAYLKASNHEIRIYQEKSIGTSICDVMAVTDRLTGYEIKSDLDNYFRLAGQIKAYDRFFDENYLVVSKSHFRLRSIMCQTTGASCASKMTISLCFGKRSATSRYPGETSLPYCGSWSSRIFWFGIICPFMRKGIASTYQSSWLRQWSPAF